MPSDPIRPDAVDRTLGSRLAEELVRLAPAAPLQLRECLPRLLGPEHPLQAPLHDLLARPGFRHLLATNGQTQRGEERDQLLDELAETYSPGVTARLGHVLDGLLEARDAPPVPPAPPANPLTPNRLPPNRLAPPSRVALRPRHRSSRARLPGLVALTTAIALSSGLLFALVRSNRLCPTLGLCLPSAGASSASIDAGLRRAAEAAEAVDRATDLDAFAAALERLDNALLTLVSRRLNPRQERQRQGLQSQADGAHRRLRQEQRALRSLEEASALIGDLERASADGSERFDVLAEARARLEEVPADSFARSAVAALEQRLAAIRERPPAVPVRPPTPEPPSGSPPAGTSDQSAPVAPVLPPPPARSPSPPTAASPSSAPPQANTPPLVPGPAAPPPLTPPVLSPPPLQAPPPP